jgi:hypothetical protein
MSRRSRVTTYTRARAFDIPRALAPHRGLEGLAACVHLVGSRVELRDQFGAQACDKAGGWSRD